MMPRTHVLLLLVLTVICHPILNAQETDLSSERPNIVIIVADDLGYTDVNPYDPRKQPFYETPNINRLAKQGLQFMSAYTNASNCAPTRAALMSGQYYPRQPVYTVNTGARGKKKHRELVPPENQKFLPAEKITLAESLKNAGYSTAFMGKWHIGKPGSTGPVEQGFDVNVGGFRAGSPYSFNGYFNPNKNPYIDDARKNEYLTDYLARKATAYVRNHADGDPFYLQLSHYSPHTPIQAPDKRTKKYRQKQPVKGHNNPTYAAMIESVDRCAGRLMNALREEGISENTIVMFYSDNGGFGGYGPFNIGKRDITNNAPLKGGKGMYYEGGIRVPLIVRWPETIPAGTTTHQPVIGLDFYPTLLEAAGVDPPDGYTLDGTSFLPVLKDPDAELGPRTLYWHFPGYLQADTNRGTWRTTPVSVIRHGPWKLMKFYETGELKLYNLENDLSETTNLVEDKPELREKMHTQLKKWLEKMDAPMPRKP